MKDNVIVVKSFAFSCRIVGMVRYLQSNQKEFIISNQVGRSGTSIGANVREGVNAQSKPDFYAKMYIAYKEANETAYWLELLHATNYIDDNTFNSIYDDCVELVKILASITKTQKTSA